MEISGNPGQSVRGEVVLVNEEKTAKTFYSSFENFEAQGETGTPNFIPGKVGLATWIKTSDKASLLPDEKKIIPFSIQIPANAEPGGYFSAIFWSTIPPKDDNSDQLGLGAKLGTLILLKVSGNIKEEGGIKEFSVTGGKKFFESLPVEFSVRLQNSGADRIMPQGEIKIKNTFGFKSAVIPVNNSNGNVLPNSTRKFTATWTGKIAEQAPGKGLFGRAFEEWRNFRFGYYRAEINLQYGGNKQVSAKYGFFLFPWQLLIIIAAILLIIGLILFFGIKKYNRWIISRSSYR
jgi:hypothetical protein